MGNLEPDKEKRRNDGSNQQSRNRSKVLERLKANRRLAGTASDQGRNPNHGQKEPNGTPSSMDCRGQSLHRLISGEIFQQTRVLTTNEKIPGKCHDTEEHEPLERRPATPGDSLGGGVVGQKSQENDRRTNGSLDQGRETKRNPEQPESTPVLSLY